MILSLNNTNGIDSVMELLCIYCEVQTTYLNKSQLNIMLHPTEAN